MQTIWQNPQNQSAGGTSNDPQKVTMPAVNTGFGQNQVGGQRIQSQHQPITTPQPIAISSNSLPITSKSGSAVPTTFKPIVSTNHASSPTTQSIYHPPNTTTSPLNISPVSVASANPITGQGTKDTTLPLTKMPPQQRQEVLIKAFKLVLNKEPTTKDLNYYKYSILTENKLTDNLLKGKEHQALMSQGQKYTMIEKAYTDLKLQAKFTQDKLSTLVEEYSIFKKLLHEKNRVIQILRQNINKLQISHPNNVMLSDKVSKIVRQSVSEPVVQSVPPSQIESDFDEHYQEKQITNNPTNHNKITKNPFKLLVSQFKELLSPPY